MVEFISSFEFLVGYPANYRRIPNALKSFTMIMIYLVGGVRQADLDSLLESVFPPPHLYKRSCKLCVRLQDSKFRSSFQDCRLLNATSGIKSSVREVSGNLAPLEVLPADIEAEAKAELNKKAHSAVILCLVNGKDQDRSHEWKTQVLNNPSEDHLKRNSLKNNHKKFQQLTPRTDESTNLYQVDYMVPMVIFIWNTKGNNCVYSLDGHAMVSELNASVEEKDSLAQVSSFLVRINVLGKSHRVISGVEGTLLRVIDYVPYQTYVRSVVINWRKRCFLTIVDELFKEKGIGIYILRFKPNNLERSKIEINVRNNHNVIPDAATEWGSINLRNRTLMERGTLFINSVRIAQDIYAERHVILQEQYAKALYSASVDDRETTGCFFECQEMRVFPRKILKPEMDLLELGLFAQSLSQLEDEIYCVRRKELLAATWNLHINFLIKVTMEKSIVDVKLLNMPVIDRGNIGDRGGEGEGEEGLGSVGVGIGDSVVAGTGGFSIRYKGLRFCLSLRWRIEGVGGGEVIWLRCGLIKGILFYVEGRQVELRSGGVWYMTSYGDLLFKVFDGSLLIR
ncbi:hypothetical protein Tco_0880819 [Tanacetum coccineum]